MNHSPKPVKNGLSEEAIYEALNKSEQGIIILSSTCKVEFWNQWMELTSKISHASAINQLLSSLFPQGLTKRMSHAINMALDSGRSSLLSQKLNKYPLPLYSSETERESDNPINQMVVIKPLYCGNSITNCLISVTDVSKSVNREKVLQEIAVRAQAGVNHLRNSEEQIRTIIESAQDGIITFSEDGSIGQFNSAAANLFQLSHSAMRSASIFNLIEDFYLANSAGLKKTSQIIKEQNINSNVIELTGRRLDSSTFPIEFTLSQLERPENPGYVSIIRDITSRKQAEERLEAMAQYDTLTGLANRSLFTERLKHAIKNTKRNSNYTILLFLDLDRFKVINDTLGHEVGDCLLVEVAKRISNTLRNNDTIARIGGDEFTIILENVSNSITGGRVAEKIIKKFDTPFDILGNKLTVSVSIGIATHPGAANSITELRRNADTAMYKAKISGRNKYCYFTSDMDEETKQRLSLETDLRKAIKNNEFTLHLQPLFNLKIGTTTGAEALIRWQHPERGNIPPAQFIPVAEDCGHIAEVGKWVFLNACKLAKMIYDAGHKEFRVSINISPKEFNIYKSPEQLVDTVKSAGIEPHNIDLEITEGCIMEDTKMSIDLLGKLSDAGFHISVDDFGTGYSSLAYLRHFPLDVLKIDQSFIRDLPQDPDAIAISKAILHLAHSLRLRVVAEGVETQEQMEFLKDNKCDVIQGYHIAKPMPAEQFINWLNKNH